MKRGNLIRYRKMNYFGESTPLLGIISNDEHHSVDHRAKNTKDNNSRWISSRILVNGCGPRLVNLYWDDDLDVISVSER